MASARMAVTCEPGVRIWAKHRESDTPLFRFVVGDKAGYIDATGRIAIPAKLEARMTTGFEDFYEGVASLDLLRTDFIDRSGRAIQLRGVPRWAHFREGLIIASRNGRYGFADHTSRFVIAPRFDGASDFAEGLAAIQVDEKFGYIDHAGRIVIEPQYLNAANFSEGRARVVRDGPCKLVSHGPCPTTQPLGSAKGKPGPCQYTFIDKSGAPAFNSHFDDALDFAQGLAAVRQGQRWGFIDRTGNLRIPLQFVQVGSFSEGLARFYKNDAWGFLDADGRIVIPPQFVEADDFSSGLAVVTDAQGQRWFIDRTGRRVFGPFTDAAAFVLGLAHVSNGEILRYIDRTGRTVFRYDARRVLPLN